MSRLANSEVTKSWSWIGADQNGPPSWMRPPQYSHRSVVGGPSARWYLPAAGDVISGCHQTLWQLTHWYTIEDLLAADLHSALLTCTCGSECSL